MPRGDEIHAIFQGDEDTKVPKKNDCRSMSSSLNYILMPPILPSPYFGKLVLPTLGPLNNKADDSLTHGLNATINELISFGP